MKPPHTPICPPNPDQPALPLWEQWPQERRQEVIWIVASLLGKAVLQEDAHEPVSQDPTPTSRPPSLRLHLPRMRRTPVGPGSQSAAGSCLPSGEPPMPGWPPAYLALRLGPAHALSQAVPHLNKSSVTCNCALGTCPKS